jgi:hypothetical protein
MANDYVPRNDGDFLNWALAWQTYATAHTAALGLTPADTGDLTDSMSVFQVALNNHTNAQNAAQAARQAKVDARETLESWLRAASKRIQAHAGTTNADRSGLGITVHDIVLTAAPMQDTRPLASVNAGQRLRHEVRWRDDTSGKRAKPAGMTGCEVWMKLGAPPTDPAECRYMGTESRPSFVTEFNGEDGGKVAHYMLRWVNKKGQKGPWSETTSATIQN